MALIKRCGRCRFWTLSAAKMDAHHADHDLSDRLAVFSRPIADWPETRGICVTQRVAGRTIMWREAAEAMRALRVAPSVVGPSATTSYRSTSPRRPARASSNDDGFDPVGLGAVVYASASSTPSAPAESPTFAGGGGESGGGGASGDW